MSLPPSQLWHSATASQDATVGGRWGKGTQSLYYSVWLRVTLQLSQNKKFNLKNKEVTSQKISNKIKSGLLLEVDVKGGEG